MSSEDKKTNSNANRIICPLCHTERHQTFKQLMKHLTDHHDVENNSIVKKKSQILRISWNGRVSKIAMLTIVLTAHRLIVGKSTFLIDAIGAIQKDLSLLLKYACYLPLRSLDICPGVLRRRNGENIKLSNLWSLQFLDQFGRQSTTS
ncbi:uncharacterized protein LOC123671635 [Harmonia axyridis]|uniref:uncharacterized protein LOC123671635 n=1 Tax=Harmonia axyridis TaxID=115357 RepID=UPI001E2790EE|nr:uncharacterized protein LOC123671635 [Harmonia axyridis]